MSAALDHNYEMLSHVAEGLGDELLSEVAFVGGSTTWLLCTDKMCWMTYLIAVVSGGLLTVAYEGDCSAGVALKGPITWFTPPHCLANWKRDRDHRALAADPGRHRITRSFRIRRAPNPEFITRATVKGETLVFATDGFWADLSDLEQAQLLDPEVPSPAHVDDDVTWIVLQT
ncbi:serine/threonine protein phosphatase [Pseudomonas monteilii]|uniref:serine/threonine protein phosphatase n=1 Tax=Pseudomonas monteilii TaxID=76759 RepID=UPI001603D371|nr:serine/threonine protein phosphatase [Pseudomonas monteilii]